MFISIKIFSFVYFQFGKLQSNTFNERAGDGSGTYSLKFTNYNGKNEFGDLSFDWCWNFVIAVWIVIWLIDTGTLWPDVPLAI